VARLAQVTLRQLQWLDERGLVSPAKAGHKRLYGPSEVVAIMAMSELRRKGLSLKGVRGILPVLKRELTRHAREDSNDSDIYLVTDLQTVHIESRQEIILKSFIKAPGPMFLVSLSDQIQRLAAEAGGEASTQQLKLFD
jgi:DNA-binding transcriptional MerR regulator